MSVKPERQHATAEPFSECLDGCRVFYRNNAEGAVYVRFVRDWRKLKNSMMTYSSISWLPILWFYIALQKRGLRSAVSEKHTRGSRT
ncbi:MAG: hypothetical protein AAFO69_05065, partial [Bacteroidota bacterium]